MDDDTYLARLQESAGAVKREERDVLLTHAAADAFASALFGLREAFLAASKVDQIGFQLNAKDAQQLFDSLRQTIDLPPAKLEMKEQRWRPDFEWAIDLIEQMLLLMGGAHERPGAAVAVGPGRYLRFAPAGSSQQRGRGRPLAPVYGRNVVKCLRG